MSEKESRDEEARTVAAFTESIGVDEYRIDPKLVSRWFALPNDTDLDLKLRRFEIDLLHSGLERMTQAQVDVITLVTAMHLNDSEKVAAAATAYSRSIVFSINSLRKFITGLMQQATHATLDENARVIEDVVDGD